MKKLIAIAAILHYCLISFAQTKKFEGGTYFTISYPSSFKIINPCKDPKHCDKLTVQSPDKKVDFFVYAPRWSDNPNVDAKAGEKEVSRKVTKLISGMVMTEVTINATNGKYSRSYVDIENKEQNYRKCFGVKYTSMDAYNKYKAQYIAFKESLEQLAD